MREGRSGKDAVLMEVIRVSRAELRGEGRQGFWLPAHVVWLIPAGGRVRFRLSTWATPARSRRPCRPPGRPWKRPDATIRESGEAKAEKQLRRGDGRPTGALRAAAIAQGQRRTGNQPGRRLVAGALGDTAFGRRQVSIEKYTIRYCVSGRDLVGRLAGTEQRTTNPVLFANPDLTVPGRRVPPPGPRPCCGCGAAQRIWLSRPGPQQPARVERLPGTADEAAAIKANVGRYAKAESVVYEDQYALKGVFTALHAPRVLVLCTHGYFMPDQDATGLTDHATALGEQGGKGRAVLTAEGRPLENPLLRCGLLLGRLNQPPGVDAQAAGTRHLDRAGNRGD